MKTIFRISSIVAVLGFSVQDVQAESLSVAAFFSSDDGSDKRLETQNSASRYLIDAQRALLQVLEVDIEGHFYINNSLQFSYFEEPSSGFYWQICQDGKFTLRSASLGGGSLPCDFSEDRLDKVPEYCEAYQYGSELLCVMAQKYHVGHKGASVKIILTERLD